MWLNIPCDIIPIALEYKIINKDDAEVINGVRMFVCMYFMCSVVYGNLG